VNASADARPLVPRPGIAFAGVFAVTFCGLVAVGAVLPVLPRFVHGPLDSGNVAVGIVIGSYAITGLLLRPFAGRLADHRGRKPTVLIGSVLVARRGWCSAPARERCSPPARPGWSTWRRRRGGAG